MEGTMNEKIIIKIYKTCWVGIKKVAKKISRHCHPSQ